MSRGKWWVGVALIALISPFVMTGPAESATMRHSAFRQSALRPTAIPQAAAPPPARHVFVVQLENSGFDATFGPGSPAPYLAKTLPSMGQLLTNYYAIGHVSLDNYVAEVSGQAPNLVTQTDCQTFPDVVPGLLIGGQALGAGCVYPTSVLTIANQLSAFGLTWKGYMEDMGNDPARDTGVTCAHPSPVGPLTIDHTQSATAVDQYATRHNPFVYFHSIIDTPACSANDVPLSHLAGDLAQVATTPNYAFIAPNLCNDGHDATCVGVNSGGTHAGGLVAVDGWLQKWIPAILNSAAFQRDGLLIVTFDEAAITDTSGCCNPPTSLGTIWPGLLPLGQGAGQGGGRVGAVLISRWIRPGTVNSTPYNHYSQLRSIEQLFGLNPLGGASTAPAFGPDVYDG
jgi:phosphatidylinositol-3-phosphatase